MVVVEVAVVVGVVVVVVVVVVVAVAVVVVVAVEVEVVVAVGVGAAVGKDNMSGKNRAAVALGKLGRGIKKTMTDAALKQRQNAARAHSEKAAKEKKEHPLRNITLMVLAFWAIGCAVLIHSGRQEHPWLDHGGDGSFYRLVEGGVEIRP